MVAIAAGACALAAFAAPRLAYIFVIVAIIALFVTAGIGVYHAGVELHLWAGPQACSGRIPTGLSPEDLKKFLFSARMVRCDEPAWKFMDISMAGWNAILSGLLAVFITAKVSTDLRTQS
jgi:disulfide bond formation protein DsbB